MAPHTIRPQQLIEFSTFDTAFAVTPDEEAAVRRRYMTLLVDGSSAPRRGSSSTVYRVSNTECAHFALKVLKTDDLDDDERSRILPVRVRKFAEEYRAQTAVSHLTGFPKLYGYGMIDDVPAILMEWVDGLTLSEAVPQLPVDVYGRVAARTVAGLGISVLGVLVAAQALDEPFVHRDLSPRNVMLRTDRTPLADQIRANSFNICLIDLGSATITATESSLTMVSGIWRNGTPDYAPPEMLACDDPATGALRSSPSIDVYALCSILYELYAQQTPYGRGMALAASPYRVKRDNVPMPLVPRSETDRPLTDAIMAGLHRDQAQRIGSAELLERLTDWARTEGAAPTQAEQVERHDDGGVPAFAGSHLTMQLPRREEPSEAAADADSGNASSPDTAGGVPTETSSPATEPTAETAADAPRRPVVSRRALVAGIGCGVAALALGGAAIATQGFGLLRPRTLDDYSWDELAQIARDMTATGSREAALDLARQIGVVDSEGAIVGTQAKHFLYKGIPCSAQVVDIMHDDLADGSGKAGLTFMFNQVVDHKPMNGTASFEGAWRESEMRSWLNGTFSQHLDDDLVEAIRPVVKLTNNVGGTKDAASVSETEDKIWLFSYCELAGARDRLSFNDGYHFLADILNAEGEQYAYFAEANVVPQSPSDLLIRTSEDEADYWWLRTPSPDVSLSEGTVNFNRVGPNGDPFHFATVCTDTAGILPGFCL